MEVDVHKIMTTLFNVELNEFLAKFDKYEVFEAIQTGGLMEIKVRDAHQFYTYVLWLKEFREQLYRKSVNFKMELDAFQREMEFLLEFYVNLKLLAEQHVFSEEAEKCLSEYFLKPFMRYINKLDETFENAYFTTRINELVSKKADITVKVVNAFNVPIENVEVKLSYVKFPELRKHAKAYFLCTLKTNDAGVVNVSLPRSHEGGYRIDVEKYDKVAFLDADSGYYVKIKVFDFLKLLKYGVTKILKRKITT